MIEDLLDEPYWPDMEKELMAFFKEKKTEGLYCYPEGKDEMARSFIKNFVAHKINRIELDYFGIRQTLVSHHFPGNEFVPSYKVLDYIDLNVVKKEISSYASLFRGSDYYAANLIGVHPGTKVLTLHKPNPDVDVSVETITEEINSTNDMDHALKLLEDLVTYKIKDSYLYKEVAND